MFYNVYAYKNGFSIRKASHCKARKKENLVTALQLTCSTAGYFKPRGGGETGSKGTPQKEMQYTRTGCKAQMRVKMIEDRRWTITTFHKEHNHTLIVSPSKSRFFRSHCFITHDKKEIIILLREQNISTTQIMSFMAAREGGAHNIPFIRT